LAQYLLLNIFSRNIVDEPINYGRIINMSNRKKNIVVKLSVRPLWELGHGHNNHRSGGGEHDSRPKRLRTRGSKSRKAIGDGW
jgi:hypothetical protein